MYWIILKIWLFFWIITHRIIRRNLLQKIIDRSILFSLPNKRIHNDNLYNKILLRNNRTTRRSNYKFSEMKRTRIILVYECDTKKYPNDINPNRTTNLTKISYLHAFIQDAFYDSNAGVSSRINREVGHVFAVGRGDARTIRLGFENKKKGKKESSSPLGNFITSIRDMQAFCIARSM